MPIEDQTGFSRFNTVSSGLREAEDRMRAAIKSGNKDEIVAAKLALMAALMNIRMRYTASAKICPEASVTLSAGMVLPHLSELGRYGPCCVCQSPYQRPYWDHNASR